MLIKANQISPIDERMEYIDNNMNILEIPLIENTRLGSYIVPIESLVRFSEEYDISCQDTIALLSETHGVSKENISVSVSEESIICMDKLFQISQTLNENSIVVKPSISEKDTFVTSLTEHFVSLVEQRVQGQAMQHGLYVDNPDELIDLAEKMNKDLKNSIGLLFKAKSEEEFNVIKDALKGGLEREKVQQVVRKHADRVGFGKIQNEMREQDLESWARHIDAEKYPKFILAKAIAKLRSLYQGIMHQWSRGWPIKLDPRIPVSTKERVVALAKHALKIFASKILRVIDILLQKAQNASDSVANAGVQAWKNLKNRISSSSSSNLKPAMA